MAPKLPPRERTSEWSGGAVDFLLHEGKVDIPCRISFDALKRHAGVSGLPLGRADRLFNWHRGEIERIALARYCAGDFSDGMVSIDTTDIGSPEMARH
jgi:hypothetical protein